MAIKNPSVRRGQPKHDYVASLEEADKSELKRLLYAIIPAMIENRKQIYTRWSYLFKFPESFPKGKIIRKEGLTDVRVMRVNKVIQWLYKHKIIPFNQVDLANQIRNESHRMRRYFQIDVDSSKTALYNVDSLLDEAVDIINADIKQQKRADKVSAKSKLG